MYPCGIPLFGQFCLANNFLSCTVCDPLFYKANCLKLSDMHELSCCKLAYKITHKDAPAGIHSLCFIRDSLYGTVGEIFEKIRDKA